MASRSRYQRGWAVAAVLVAILCSQAPGGVITVNADGTGDYPTIQAAIDAAVHGDEVILLPGTYTGDGNHDIDYLGKAITVRGTDPNDPVTVSSTVIDCQGTEADPHRGFCFDSGETAGSVLDGVTVTNGFAPSESIWDPSYPPEGGGVYCDQSSPTIRNCVIRNNSAYSPYGDMWMFTAGIGGGIYCHQGSPTIRNCTIRNNRLSPPHENLFIEGYGGLGAGICSIDASPYISGCVITENETPGFEMADWTTSCGGGVYLEGGSPIVEACRISGNRTGMGGSGGGLYAAGGALIQYCEIMNNTADLSGGGLLAGGARVQHCVIRGNTTYWLGGGIYAYSATLLNCLIVGNRAWGWYPDGSPWSREAVGAGIYMHHTTVLNSTICGNQIKEYGHSAGVYCADGGVVVRNCIVTENAGNQVGRNAKYRPAVTYSNVQGGWPGEGNIDADPCFVDPEGGDYHLSLTSPCINAGDPACEGLDEGIDIDGEPRVMGRRVDMGIDEVNVALPLLDVWPSTIRFSTLSLDQSIAPQTLIINNAGRLNLNWRIYCDCPWLSVSQVAGTISDTAVEVILSVDETQLPGHPFTCELLITSGSIIRPGKTIPVAVCIAGELHVPSQYPTISQAVTSALDGDSVILAPGTYTGPGNKDINFMGKAIAVRSGNPNDPDTVAATVMDCNGCETEPHRAFSFTHGEGKDSMLSGLTIINGVVKSSNKYDSSAAGGGVLCQSASPTIFNCRFISNSANAGGALSCADYSSPVVIGSLFEANTAYRGGAVSAGGPSSSEPKFTNCTFIANRASEGGACRGAGNFVACTFIENTASSYGGALQVTGLGRISVSACTLKRNAAARGGAISIDLDATLYCDGSILTGNHAVYGGAIEGYGIYDMWYSYCYLRSCLLTGNSATNTGGAIQDSTMYSLIIDSCTFAQNAAGVSGGAVCREDIRSLLRMNNCILWANAAPQGTQLSVLRGMAGTTQLSYCNVSDGPDRIYAEPNDAVQWLQGSISVMPGFVFPGVWDPNSTPEDPNDDIWVEGDYHLRFDSPCIDAGNPSAAGTRDIDGEPRRMNGRIDIGADEVGPRQQDLTRNGRVDFEDVALLRRSWLTRTGDPDWYLLSDFNTDGRTDLADLAALAQEWLWEADWFRP